MEDKPLARCSMVYLNRVMLSHLAYDNWFTLSTYYSESDFLPADWISQAEAARIRGVTRQAIARLIERGRLRILVIGGHTLVHRIDVETFIRQPAGRPREKEDGE